LRWYVLIEYCRRRRKVNKYRTSLALGPALFLNSVFTIETVHDLLVASDRP
jgi:hypothetical protein